VRVLVTGSAGFAGQYLIQHIMETQPDVELYGTVYHTKAQRNTCSGVICHHIDLLNLATVRQMLDEIQPEAIYHLAGQSSPSRSIASTWPTLETNIRAQLNLIEACIELHIKPRFLITSSAEVYKVTATTKMPLTEDNELRPNNAYALSKITQDMMANLYFNSHAMPTICARPFNHIGPGQSESFVAPDFALQIARIEAGFQDPVMRVGNLSAKRDFTDVRDTVRAYTLLMEQGEPGRAYNVASNNAYSIQYLLDTLLSFTETEIEVQVEEARLRPVEIPIKQGDYSRLHGLTGWQPQIPFEQTLQDLLNECRERVHQETRSN